MERPPFKARELADGVFSYPKGINAGVDPSLLPKDQLASGVNTTVRGDFVRPRPKFRKIELSFVGYEPGPDAALFDTGHFQGAGAYNPDSGLDSLMASISGHLFRLHISGNTAFVDDVSIPGDLDDPAAEMAWIIQAEKWALKTDGTLRGGLPTPMVIYNGTSSRRSLTNTLITFSTTIATSFSIPAVGTDVGGATPIWITLVSPFAGNIGDTINVLPAGAFLVTAKSGSTVQLKNLNASPVGAIVQIGYAVNWAGAGCELPGGRQMAYGMGRVWLVLVDGKQFMAGDLVGGSSGTVAENFRDSVFNATENSYILGGGYFTVPGTYGEIRAMCFAETLDSSLGQGALQVFTPNVVFSCNAPVDRLTWQSLTSPILTESVKGGGATGQWATVNANSDILYRHKDGDRSMSLARRDFNTWGNTPISQEVRPQMDRDSTDLLRFASRVTFDNRSLLTSEGVLDLNGRGVYFKRLVPINFDPNSSLQGKDPSVYDALYWTGLNIFQLISGDFGSEDRCFAFTLNNFTGKIELWEILKSKDPAIYDNDDVRVVWGFEYWCDFQQTDPRARERLRLDAGEIYVDELRGAVDFQVYYKPDAWPCWVPLHAWTECSNNVDPATPLDYRPTMGLPEPSSAPCDPANNRPLREGYGFHFKYVITGQCRFRGARHGAWTVPQPRWTPPTCTPICQDQVPKI